MVELVGFEPKMGKFLIPSLEIIPVADLGFGAWGGGEISRGRQIY